MLSFLFSVFIRIPEANNLDFHYLGECRPLIATQITVLGLSFGFFPSMNTLVRSKFFAFPKISFASLMEGHQRNDPFKRKTYDDVFAQYL